MRPGGAELFHAEERTNRHNESNRHNLYLGHPGLRVAFRNSVNAPKKDLKQIGWRGLGSCGSVQAQVCGGGGRACCAYGNDLSDSIKCGEFLH
jgi:hypothetical protein